MRFFIDMDGVLCDWMSGTLSVFGLTMNDVTGQQMAAIHEVTSGGSEDAMWTAIDAHGEAWWENLEPYPWAKKLWKQCEKLGDTCVLTKPSRNPQSASGKAKWIKRHLNTRSFLIGPPKHFCAQPNALLIDDLEVNCDRFRYFGGMSLLFPQPWNANRHLHVDHVFDTIRSKAPHYA